MTRDCTAFVRQLAAATCLAASPGGVVLAGEGGSSNYIPGFYGDQAIAVAPPDGLSLRNDVFILSGDASRTIDAGRVQADADLLLVYNYTTFLYKPYNELFGLDYAVGATITLGNADIDASLATSAGGLQTGDSHTGLGDPTLSFYLYENWDRFHIALASFVVVPLGDYESDRLANTGLNYWTFEVDVMATYLNEDTGQDYSIVVGYGYNTENTATDYKTGDEFHVDVTLNQYFSPEFGAGVNGYYFRQLSGDSGPGAVLGDFRGEAAGLGPAVYWNPTLFGRQFNLVAKWIHDVHAENRFDSDYIYASFSTSF